MMKRSGRIEELFLPLWRKIESLESLDPKLVPKKPEIETSLKVISFALQAAKKWEKQVKDDVAESIKKIDDLIEDYNHNTVKDSKAGLDDKTDTCHELFNLVSECDKQMKAHTRSYLQQLNNIGKDVLEDHGDEDLIESMSIPSQQINGKDPNNSESGLHLKGHEVVAVIQQLNGESEGVLVEEKDEMGLIEDKIITLQTSVDKEPNDSKLVKLIIECVKQIEDNVPSSLLKMKGKEQGDSEDDRDENDPLQQELWLTSAKKNLRDLLVTGLQSRYNVLEPLLKRCLLYFSVFPEESVIRKRSIIYWWIGEDLVKPSKGLTAEQVGEECYKMLILNGLILPISKKHDKTARYCMLYAGFQKMLISRAREACLFEFDHQGRLTMNGIKCKRACLMASKKEEVVDVYLGQQPNELISVFNISAQYLKCEKDAFSKLKSISVLHLGRWQTYADHHIEISDTMFLDSLSVMKNLKYLSLQGISRITVLPDSLACLTNLQILDLRACHNLEMLPSGVTLLKNLTHLDVSECSLLDRLPKGLGSLSELQVLKGFIISSGRINDPCRLRELAGLKKLRKLSINIATGAQADDDLNELKKFTTLRSLTINWGRVTASTKSSPAISLPNLEKLDLQCIPQHEKLSWLKPGEFRLLKKLYIRGGKLKSLNLDVGTEKWNVETLRLKFLKELEWNDWSELETAFPSLACVEIHECPKLKERPRSLPPLDENGVWIKKKKQALKINSADSMRRNNQLRTRSLLNR